MKLQSFRRARKGQEGRQHRIREPIEPLSPQEHDRQKFFLQEMGSPGVVFGNLPGATISYLVTYSPLSNGGYSKGFQARYS